MTSTKRYFKRLLGHCLLEEVSLGLYLDALPLRAIVLTETRKQGRLVGHYEWMPADIQPQPITSFKDRTITVDHWRDFLHYLIDQLSRDLSATPTCICQQLQVTVGIDYQSCAWLPMPHLTQAQTKTKGYSSMMHWKRSAATHWQISPQDVWVDVLVLGKDTGLLGSVPRESLQTYVDSLGVLQPLSERPVQISLSTHLDCLLQIWPWFTRQQLALMDLHQGQVTYLDETGIHTIALAQLPNHIAHILLCEGDKNLPPQICASPINLWRWCEQDLDKQWLIPWHLAFVPPFNIKAQARPLAAWQRVFRAV